MMYNECTVVKYENLADTIYTVAHHPMPILTGIRLIAPLSLILVSHYI